ncbi:MAG: ATP-binding protein [Clostridiales bacterium]|nr:ATP-binding protein [Clostridiales bacterium]
MQVSKVYSCFNDGTGAVLSEIEVSVTPGIPTFSVLGLCDSSIREAQGRLHSALAVSGFKMPKGHVTVSISPAYMKKSGSGFDLPIALGILFASSQLPEPPGKRVYAEGELSLKGEIKATPGCVKRLVCMRQEGFDIKIIPEEEERSAAVAGYRGALVSSLSEARSVFGLKGYCERVLAFACGSQGEDPVDISLLKGQEKAKRAIILSAAGFHNILLVGSPGSGKTMAGRILTGLIPPLYPEEIPEVYALAEAVEGDGAEPTDTRPCRYAGPAISVSGLLGNSSNLAPGELALADHGVLLADELCEYKPEVLEALRQPLEDREIRLTKSGKTFVYPARFIFAGTANPCKCGLYLEPGRKCRCTPGARKRYMGKLSGPLLDRIDIVSEMTSISGADMASICENNISDETVRIRNAVAECWERQHDRYRKLGNRLLNATVRAENPAEAMRIPQKVAQYASELSEKGFFSARGFTGVLRVARTIADLDGREDVGERDVSEAAIYRTKLFE